MATKTPSALAQLHFDIFVTALEGGINYWSQCGRYHNSLSMYEEDVFGFYAEIIDVEDDDKGYRIDKDVIAKGYRLATSREWRSRLAWSSGEKPPLVVGPETDWDCDAGDADMIVQLGLFEDVRYG